MSTRTPKRSRRLNPEDPPTPESSDRESDSSSTTTEEDNMNTVTFSLTPAQANSGDIIDYTTTAGLKIYNAATEALPVKFDCQSKSVSTFCEKLIDRANEAGWKTGASNMLTIPDSNGEDRSLLTEYGRLTEEDIRNHADTYMANESRQAQNNVQMYNCLTKSLTEEGHLKIMEEADSYTSNGVAIGTLHFKLLMSTAVVDTRATASHLRENLTSLDAYMVTVHSNVELFNLHVKENRQGLKARGESTDDLMINLFKGYMAASDKEFAKYIRLKKDEYDEGKDISEERLMKLALNKYTNMKRDGDWNAPSAEQKQIVALRASLDEMKKEGLQLSKGLKNGGKTSWKGKNPKSEGKTFKPKKGKGQGKEEQWAWKKVPPSEGQSHQKKKDEKSYNWCKYHQAWVLHDPSECQKNPDFQAEEKPKRNKVSFAAKLNQLLAEDSDEE